ncbi:MAG: hypothetical protein ACNA71_00675 [Kiritimatiellia bacterium]
MQRYLIKYTIRTIISLFVLLIVISAVRATTVIIVIRKVAAGQSTNTRLARQWAAHHPQLWQTLENLLPEDQKEFLAYRTAERTILFAPDLVVNFLLGQTSVFWLPWTDDGQDVQAATTHTPSQQPASVSTPPRRPARTTPAAVPATQQTPLTHPPAQTAARTPPPMTVTGPVTQDPEQPPAVPFDPNAKWAAIITPATPLYTLDGQRSDQAAPGSVMEITTERRTTNGALYVGNVHSPSGRFRNVGVREQDLHIYVGKSLHDTTREEREFASERARITGAITARKQELENAQANRNPHQQPLIDVLRRYQSYRQEAEKLQGVYDNSSGTQRINAGSRLREINQEIGHLTPIIRNLRQQRDAWNDANPQGPAADPDRDSRIIELRQQLAQYE